MINTSVTQRLETYLSIRYEEQRLQKRDAESIVRTYPTRLNANWSCPNSPVG